MKNINTDFCFKKKISKLYHQRGVFLCFQSFLTFEQLQNTLGDHRVNLHLFNINNFWNKHYPPFYCSNINSYSLYIKNLNLNYLNSLLSNSNLNFLYILLNNRFYNLSYFKQLNSEHTTFPISFLLKTVLSTHLFSAIYHLQKVILFFVFLLTKTNIKK